MRHSLRFPALLILALAPWQAAYAQTGAVDGQWRFYGGGPGATRYAPLDQITPDNVADLEIVWRWAARNQGPSPEIKNATTPLMVDGVLYATAGARRNVVALDAASGEMLWMHRLVEGQRGQNAPRANSGRGVAYWSDGAGDRRILVVTPGYHLVALNAETGHRIEGFGKHGVVDLKKGLGRPVDPIDGIIGSSSPPAILGDVAIVGAALEVGLRPPSRVNVPGHVRGFDVRTGRQLWIFHTIPQPGELGNDTWKDESWSYSGNTAVWAPMSVDEELGYVYLPVEAATGDYYGGHRPGNNLFSTSLVALDGRTGERAWHDQIVHHDIWDRDNPSAPILADIEVDGRRIQAVVQLTKQSFAYVFDRVTGEPVWPIEERPVPQSDVPGEWTSPTQPFPTKPAPFDRQGFTSDDLIDFTPELRAQAEEIASNYRFGSLFSPPSLADADDGTRGTLQLPGITGGANWEAGAFDPEEGILNVGSATEPSVMALVSDPDVSDMLYIAGPYTVRGPQALPLVKPPWGRITAIDLNTGEHLWMVPNGEASALVKRSQALQGVDLTRTGKATRAGILVTKTLVLAGEGYGGDPVLRAHDKRTGEVLAKIELPAAQIGLPMTYLHEGRQYVVMSVGGGGQPGELVALALPNER